MIQRIYKQICAHLEKRRLDEINRKAAALYNIGDYTDSRGVVHVGVFVGGYVAYYVGDEGTLAEALAKVEALRKEFINKEMKEGAL